MIQSRHRRLTSARSKNPHSGTNDFLTYLTLASTVPFLAGSRGGHAPCVRCTRLPDVAYERLNSGSHVHALRPKMSDLMADAKIRMSVCF